MFEIATSSSSSEKQELNDNAVANNNNNNNVIEENKPELGQGFFKDLEIFIEREPPIAVGFLFLFLINGVWGVIFTLFIRETNAGPGGGVRERSRRIEERNRERDIQVLRRRFGAVHEIIKKRSLALRERPLSLALVVSRKTLSIKDEERERKREK